LTFIQTAVPAAGWVTAGPPEQVPRHELKVALSKVIVEASPKKKWTTFPSLAFVNGISRRSHGRDGDFLPVSDTRASNQQEMHRRKLNRTSPRMAARHGSAIIGPFYKCRTPG
jgi:hypothetical protein